MTRDRLILLLPGFADANQPGVVFVCPDCLPVEGLLLAAPHLQSRLEIERVSYPRPRPEVVNLLGEVNQSLPVLILGDELTAPEDAQSFQGRRFVNDTRRILKLLADRHGFPSVH